MNLYRRIIAYLYAVALSLWGIILLQGENFFPENQSHNLEISSGKVGSQDQLENLFVVNQSHNRYVSTNSAFRDQNIDQFLDKPPFLDLYWKIFGATVLSYLEGVHVEFPSTDIIFPFHFFW